MSTRGVEAAFLGIMALAVLLGGRSLLVQIATLHGVAISALVILAIVIIYAFRRNFRAGVPNARLSAARDTAFLAAIAASIAFILSPARWSLGAAVVALEVGIVVELLARLVPTGAELPPAERGTK